MPTTLQLSAGDRLLVFAPHPDDEAIACGGLLLAARSAGAARGVIVVTDGDNNPWPQRWIEKRWRIDAAARARWGARRRAEAQAALEMLGVDSVDRSFLGLPDSGLTSMLVRETEVLVGQFAAQISRFRPTRIALPALADEHPDHSAVHVAVRLALTRLSMSAELLVYAVHGASKDRWEGIIHLSEEQQRLKRDAILCHQTQMRLSGRRFLHFARDIEGYMAASEEPRGNLPLQGRVVEHGVEISIDKTGLRDAVRKLRLLVLADAPPGGEPTRLELPLLDAGSVDAKPSLPHGAVFGEWRADRDRLKILVQLASAGAPVFFKLERRRRGLVIYDRCGWQTPQKNLVEFGRI